MASFTFSQVVRIPPSTAVNLYAVDAFGNQTGSSLQSGTTDSNGQIVWTGLADSTSYITASASAAIKFTTPPTAYQVTSSMLTPGGFGTAFGLSLGPRIYGALSDSAATANNAYFVEVDVPWPVTITGVRYEVGTTGGAGTVQCGIYSAAGNRLAYNSTPVAGAAAFNLQKVPFDAPYAAAQGTYYAVSVWTSASQKFTAGIVFCSATSRASSAPLPTSFTPADGVGSLASYPVLTFY